VTYVPLPPALDTGDTTRVITDVIIHIAGEMPIKVDIEEMPHGSDRSIRCTNVRTVDGKRPAFVHDRNSTFILPLSTIRVIEVPATSAADGTEPQTAVSQVEAQPNLEDEEPDEDLLARIRSL
jgi:hypothetical protein